MDPISLGAIGTMSATTAGNAGFWSGLGSKLGTLGGGAKSFLSSPGGGMIGSSLLGGMMGGEEESEFDKEKAQSEKETRRWEERNAAPTAGIGQYLARATALQQFPILGAINNIDFLYNKVLPYVSDYGGARGQNISKLVNQAGSNIGDMLGNAYNNIQGAFNRRKR